MNGIGVYWNNVGFIIFFCLHSNDPLLFSGHNYIRQQHTFFLSYLFNTYTFSNRDIAFLSCAFRQQALDPLQT